MIMACISLGVSSGFSVYEAELIQEEKRINEIEKALITDLDGTIITQKSRLVTIFSSFLVFLTPLVSCVINLIPAFLVFFRVLNFDRISLYIIFLNLSLIFLTGLFVGEENRILKGIRMTILGSMVFLFGFLLNKVL
jgi:predicted membrane protein (TIGR00267 family)